MTFCLFIKCIANETSLLNEFVIELAVDENAREVIEGMGFKFIRKVSDKIIINGLHTNSLAT